MTFSRVGGNPTKGDTMEVRFLSIVVDSNVDKIGQIEFDLHTFDNRRLGESDNVNGFFFENSKIPISLYHVA